MFSKSFSVLNYSTTRRDEETKIRKLFFMGDSTQISFNLIIWPCAKQFFYSFYFLKVKKSIFVASTPILHICIVFLATPERRMGYSCWANNEHIRDVLSIYVRELRVALSLYMYTAGTMSLTPGLSFFAHLRHSKE